MDPRISEIPSPLFAFNKKRETLLVISQFSATFLISYALKSKEFFSKPLHLDFAPVFLSSSDEFLLIQGEDILLAYNLDSEKTYSIGPKGPKILSSHWHPLSDRSVGVLTNNSVLAIYTLPSGISEFSFDFAPLDVCSFCFFEEKPLNLFRFGSAVLTRKGEIYILSPALPKSLMLDHDFLDFPSIFSIPNNSYIRYEEQIIDWMGELHSKIIPESLNWTKICVEKSKFSTPVLRGPCYSAGADCDDLQVLCSSNPSVLMIKTLSGNLQVAIAAGDLIPSFSYGEPSLEWNLYEEFGVRANGKTLCMEGIIFFLNSGNLMKIDLPWVADMKKCYALKKAPKGLVGSAVSKIRECNGLNLAFYAVGMKKNVIVSMNKGFFEVSLQSVNKELVLEVNRRDFVYGVNKMPDVRFPDLAGLKKITAEISDFQGEESEIIELVQKFEEFLTNSAKPLADRVEEIKEKIEECERIDEGLAKNYEIIAQKAAELEKYSVLIGEKMQNVEENDKNLRKRVQDLIDIQQNVKRPLTDQEKELRAKLTHLESASKQLKTHANEVFFP